ncbi:MAG: type II and III secretion system protein family protein [Pseudomonadota bacterium]
MARGLASNDITVLINRAIVIDSAESFVEVSVAQPEIADVSPLSDRSLYIFGKARGTTTLTLLGEGGRLITNVLIRVEPDLNELKTRLRTLLPNEPVEVRTAGAGLVLSGVVSGKAKIDRAMSLARAYAGNAVTNMMVVGGTQQVNLRVKIAEVDRNAAKDLGIGTQFAGTTTRVGAAGTSGGAGATLIENSDVPFPQIAGGSTTPQGSASLLSDFVAGFGSLGAIFSITDTLVFNLQIAALESKGFARSLAEPNIVALSGEQASLLVGGEAPIPVVDDEGTVSVEFKNIGVSMNFVPTVIDEDLINVSVSAEVAEIDPTVTSDVAGVSVFGFSTQRATTVVELRDGQSFAIAGLIQSSFTDTIDQVPLLGDLPVLGPLFRSTSFTRGDTEFVVMITATLVVPVDDESQISLPTDRLGIPNEFDLFVNGKTQELTPAGRQVAGQGLDGDYGYVVE